jgi:F-type H+-transporting ATPase subunit epsilon
MANQLSLSVVTPERVLYEGAIRYLSVPGSAGYMGILVDHAPIISSLKPGLIEIRPAQPGSSSVKLKIQKPGFMEINKNQVDILLDATDSNALSTEPSVS